MGNQWGDIYLCVPPTKMLGDVSPVAAIIAAPADDRAPTISPTREYLHAA